MEQEIARDQAVDDATALMARFAERTGLMSSRTPHRYLWTDAFAVCNFLSLARLTGLTTYRELALALIDQVHQVLGRFRADDVRTGSTGGRDRWLLSIENQPYERQASVDGIQYRDLYLTDVRTGARSEVKKQMRGHASLSPDGRTVLFWDDRRGAACDRLCSSYGCAR